MTRLALVEHFLIILLASRMHFPLSVGRYSHVIGTEEPRSVYCSGFITPKISQYMCVWYQHFYTAYQRRLPPSSSPASKTQLFLWPIMHQMFLSLLLVWNVGILSNEEALSGFNNPGILVVGALYLVVSAIEKSTMAEQAARRILGLTTTFTIGFSRLMICALCMSSFTNNTPVTALLIPIVQDWARTRGFDPAVLLMPLSFVCAFGGILTTVGGGTNLLIQGMLFEAGKSDEKIQPFKLFEPAYVGLPLAFVGIIYLLFAAPRILGTPWNVGRRRRPARGCSEDLLTEVRRCRGFKSVPHY